jgi:hypothetical protein
VAAFKAPVDATEWSAHIASQSDDDWDSHTENSEQLMPAPQTEGESNPT